MKKVLLSLFNKADQTEERYELALERKQEELMQLKLDLKEASIVHAEFQKMKILGDITGEVYDAEARKVEAIQKQIQEVQKEIQLIDKYRTDDVKSVLEELDAEKLKGSKEYHAELEKLKLELIASKLEYLRKMKESKEKYDMLVAPTRKLDMLKQKVGLQKHSYVSGSYEALNYYSLPDGSHEFLIIETPEISNALGYGRIPERLEKIVKDAKDKGII
ncbi:hypothetical protein [Bacillus sp. CHD6a]|uniref:hypothetical protein n=1 Tax=Bacillus sp. CHD6a TaxID=1643452 RepID=UPI0006CE0F6A|nr:hypothetical protein [Bacillus sp. CHD6a]KPB06327.1 hypothetical protein AAV98_00535 [Bacillus sp. CHD6a]